MNTQSPFRKTVRVVFLFGVLAWSLFHFLKAGAMFSPRLMLSNVTTQGKVLYVGPSVVSSSSSVIGYGYNAPQFPRKPWSFQREQSVPPGDLPRFKVGMAVPVEYASVSPGASRLKGYGRTGSVFLDDLGLMLLVAFAVLVFALISWSRTRHST